MTGLHRFDLADRAYAAALRLVGRRRKSSTTRASPTCCAATMPAPQELQEAQAKDPSNPYVQANLQLLEESYRNGRSVSRAADCTRAKP